MQPNIGFVTPFGTDGASAANISPEDAVLYVGNLHSEADDQLIYQHFLPYGKVEPSDPGPKCGYQEELVHRRKQRLLLRQLLEWR